MLGCNSTPSKGSGITILKPNNHFPLEVNQLVFRGGGQAAARLLGAWHSPEPGKGHTDQEVRKAAMTQIKDLQPWEVSDWCAEVSDWCVCKRHCNCFIFAWHLWRVSLLGLYLSPTADWGDLREENVIINLLRQYEYKRIYNNSGSIYLRCLHHFGEMFTHDLWLWCSATHQT